MCFRYALFVYDEPPRASKQHHNNTQNPSPLREHPHTESFLRLRWLRLPCATPTLAGDRASRASLCCRFTAPQQCPPGPWRATPCLTLDLHVVARGSDSEGSTARGFAFLVLVRTSRHGNHKPRSLPPLRSHPRTVRHHRTAATNALFAVFGRDERPSPRGCLSFSLRLS